MAICPIIVHFSAWRARSMHDVACEFARAVVRSKDAQKQLARTSLNVTRHTRICSMYFKGGLGPTKLNPICIPTTSSVKTSEKLY